MTKTKKKKDPTWWRVIKRIYIFFLRLKRQEVLTFMVFLCISAAFWAMRTYSEFSVVSTDNAKSKKITITQIHTVDVPDGEFMSIFPNEIEISCLVDRAHYDEITADDFFVSVSYNSIKSPNQRYIPIRVASYADAKVVTKVKLLTEKVEYVLTSK